MFDVASIDATEGSRGPTRRAVVPPVRHRNAMAPAVVDSYRAAARAHAIHGKSLLKMLRASSESLLRQPTQEPGQREQRQ